MAWISLQSCGKPQAALPSNVGIHEDSTANAHRFLSLWRGQSSGASQAQDLTNCNCSICRRYGVLWAYYKDAEVRLAASPGATDEYIWGDKTQKFIRCKECGCVMQWKKLNVSEGTNTAPMRGTSSLRHWGQSRFASSTVLKPGSTLASLPHAA